MWYYTVRKLQKSYGKGVLFICQECLAVIAQSQLLSREALNRGNNTELVWSQTSGEMWEW